MKVEVAVLGCPYLKGPIKAVSGHKIAPNRFKTTYRSVLMFEEKKQSCLKLFLALTRL